MTIFGQFGVREIINASGAVTRLGGAIMPDAVRQAFLQAAEESVPLDELQAAASRVICAHTGTEAALVTAGSAAALTLGTAAILAGDDLARMESLPHCDGFPNEILIAREQRSGYDHAIRAAGARLVEVGFNEIIANAGVRRTEVWEYDAAITSQTAGIAYVCAPDSSPPLSDLVAMADARGIPVLVDAAGELSDPANLRRIPESGAALVSFSGGKALRGPQSSGILCGTSTLVRSAALQMLDMDDHWDLWDPPRDFIDKSQLGGMPRHGIGRSLKVSKEEVAALLVALEGFASRADEDHDEVRSWLEATAGDVRNASASAQCHVECSNNRPPTLVVTLESADRAFRTCRNLRNGEPGVFVGHGRLAAGQLVVDPSCVPEHRLELLKDRVIAALAAID